MTSPTAIAQMCMAPNAFLRVDLFFTKVCVLSKPMEDKTVVAERK